MTEKLSQALQNVEMTYADLIEIANEMTRPLFEPIDQIVNRISDQTNSLPVDYIRDSILELQLKAYSISDIKEKSALKAELAEALQKEKYAISFNGMDGSAAAKDKLALVAVSEEILTETLYNLVANLFKTKVDQIHRLVSALSTILMSRGQEMKFMNIGSTNEIEPTRRGQQILHEGIL